MFCVASKNSGTRRSISAMATCAAFGCASRASCARFAYQRHASEECCRYPRGFAYRSTSALAQSALSPERNVGMPDSAETPAPVKTTTELAARSACAAASMALSTIESPGTVTRSTAALDAGEVDGLHPHEGASRI